MEKILYKLKRYKVNKKNIGKTYEGSGVYIFLDEKYSSIYIGKSTSVRKRLKSYLLKDLSAKTSAMMSEAQYFSYIRVNSEIEALLLEAKLIKLHKPIYNSQLKDDKNPLYIRITDEKYPRVLTARKIDQNEKNLEFFGPFPSSKNVRNVLYMLRKIFPYAQHKPGKRGCLYSQMGFCKPCPSIIENERDEKVKKELVKEYRRNINYTKNVLSGNFVFVKRRLEKKMKEFSKNEKYESAAKIREKLKMLDYITQPVINVGEFLKNPNLIDDVRRNESQELKKIIFKKESSGKKLERIECFDVAHLAGSFPTASMVTFINGEPYKKLYRHFKIRQKKGADDISSMEELARRREKYLADWGIPDLIIVDGGKAQASVFNKVFKEQGVFIVGLAKRFETLVIPEKGSYRQIILPKGNALNLVKRIRDEAHRFARRYHHNLISKSLLKT
jgi:excinuclease ABC subunit C